LEVRTVETRPATIPLEPQAFSIAEFCARNRISLSTFHKLKNQGQGPRLMCLGRAIRISIEAERDVVKNPTVPKPNGLHLRHELDHRLGAMRASWLPHPRFMSQSVGFADD
jgi:hypothetical protein